MGTYPWGPHGPQSGPNEVTPNPTPAYVPPPSSTDWSAPASTPSYGGGGYQQPTYSGGGAVGYTGPHTKSYFFAILLSAIFGPLGLFYATKKGGLVMLLLLFGYPIALTALGHAPGVYEAGNPISIIGNDLVMNPLWKMVVPVCVIWSVIGVMGYNRKARSKNPS